MWGGGVAVWGGGGGGVGKILLGNRVCNAFGTVQVRGISYVRCRPTTNRSNFIFRRCLKNWPIASVQCAVSYSFFLWTARARAQNCGTSIITWSSLYHVVLIFSGWRNYEPLPDTELGELREKSVRLGEGNEVYALRVERFDYGEFIKYLINQSINQSIEEPMFCELESFVIYFLLFLPKVTCSLVEISNRWIENVSKMCVFCI